MFPSATKAVVPHRETIDAVANGILDGDLNAVSYFAGRDPAFAIIGDLIAGYDTVDQVRTFCMHGGGKEILQKLYDKYNAWATGVAGLTPLPYKLFTISGGAFAINFKVFLIASAISRRQRPLGQGGWGTAGRLSLVIIPPRR